jgi:hypothetical protein
MKQRIYIDTSVVGGYFDDEFKEATIKLFDRLENNEIKFVVSDLLDLELLNAPQQVKEHLFQYSPDKFGGLSTHSSCNHQQGGRPGKLEF